MNLTLNVWRQKDARAKGAFVTYEAKDISPDMSFLEMLDVVNDRLSAKGEGQKPERHVEPLVFENVPLQTRSYK